MPGARCVIVGGAGIRDYEGVRSYLKTDDYMIYCDGGLRHQAGLMAAPDLIVGDFDSYENPLAADPHLATETIVLPTVKDDTDTVFAVKEALRRGFADFLLVGATGERMDHSLANLSILLMLDTLGKKALLVDDYEEMEVVSRETAVIEERYPYFSLLNISGTAEGVWIEDARYPLCGASITCEYAYGVSNEVLPGRTARVRLEKGRLLLIRIRPVK